MERWAPIGLLLHSNPRFRRACKDAGLSVLHVWQVLLVWNHSRDGEAMPIDAFEFNLVVPDPTWRAGLDALVRHGAVIFDETEGGYYLRNIHAWLSLSGSASKRARDADRQRRHRANSRKSTHGSVTECDSHTPPVTCHNTECDVSQPVVTVTPVTGRPDQTRPDQTKSNTTPLTPRERPLRSHGLREEEITDEYLDAVQAAKRAEWEQAMAGTVHSTMVAGETVTERRAL